MRLERVPPASAILVLLLAAIGPGAFAASPPSASILAPGEGETIGPGALVRIHYAGYSVGAQNISGYLMLGGEPAGTFTLRTSPASAVNETTFDARLAAGSFASGVHALSARVFTERDNPVDTPSVSILLDKPPVVSDISTTYDLDARQLLVTGHVADDGGASLLRLESSVHNATTLADGAFAMTLDAPRAVGTYPATLRANDSFGHSTVVNFSFVVTDREADLVVLVARYQLGGTLNVTGTATDADGLSSVTVSVSNVSKQARVQNGTWSVNIAVVPHLGTFNGTVTARDVWGGDTSVPFQYTIGGAREVLYERTVTTENGAHVDHAVRSLPAVLGGIVEICSGICDATGNATSEELYRAACGTTQQGFDNPHCRALTGRPLTAGAFAMCEGSTTNPTTNLLWGAARTVTDPLPVGPCRSVFDRVNATEAAAGPREGWLVAAKIQAGWHPANGTQACAAAGTPTDCRFDAPRGALIDLAWAQGPRESVTVRITGVRV